MGKCNQKQVARVMGILCLPVVVACGGSGDTARPTDEATEASSATNRGAGTAAPALRAFTGTAISCSVVQQPPRVEEFDVIAEETTPPFTFAEEVQNHTHSLVVFPWHEDLRLRMSEAGGDSLGVKVEILSGTVGAQEYWGILTLDAQSCWNEAKDAVAFSHVHGANKRDHWSRKDTQSHAVEILLRGNSTYTLGTPGMVGAEADTEGSPGNSTPKSR